MMTSSNWSKVIYNLDLKKALQDPLDTYKMEPFFRDDAIFFNINFNN